MTARPTALSSMLLLLSLSACSCPTTQAAAPQEKTMESPKRRVPNVAPVVAGNTRYEVVRGARSRGFAQNGGVIAAIDVASGKELWTLMLYETAYDAQEEKDVQDRFITEMSLSTDRQSLLVKSENKKTYLVKLADRAVTVQP
ncbi:hypothetical protein [Aquabacterium sp.]|uniref:hypothetical protein n=1 Tax=Aquabacterium sp. TaxID=1872578 RepID=UPI002488011A|nr:hypothetical protein [Aquabacterium sp.]MDI1261227.1 hypothetical protein [Aquabacterium sp.]